MPVLGEIFWVNVRGAEVMNALSEVLLICKAIQR